MTVDYYNRDTIDAKLDSIHETLKTVEKQTIATNGRVRSLEKWKIALTTAIIVVAAMGIPNISALAKLFSGI